MNRIQDHRARQAAQSTQPLSKRGLQDQSQVSIPLDVLQSIASIAQKQLERRPPKLKLRRKKQSDDWLFEARPMAEIRPLVSKATEETTLDIAQFVLRRQADILQSGSDGAKAGLASLERMLIMFQQVHMMETGTQFARAKT